MPTSFGYRVIPSLLVEDLDRTIAFYREKLGFRLTGLWPDNDEPEWAELARDGVALQFYQEPLRELPAEPAEPAFTGTLYFFPESVNELAEELKDRVEFEWGMEVTPYGQREFAIRDPDGYLLAFAEPAD